MSWETTAKPRWARSIALGTEKIISWARSYGVRVTTVGKGPPSAGMWTSVMSSTPSLIGQRRSNSAVIFLVVAFDEAIAKPTM